MNEIDAGMDVRPLIEIVKENTLSGRKKSKLIEGQGDLQRKAGKKTIKEVTECHMKIIHFYRKYLSNKIWPGISTKLPGNQRIFHGERPLF